MSVPIKDLSIYKGQYDEKRISITGSGGVVNISADKILFYVKKTINGDPIITKDTDTVTEIEKTDAVNGAITIFINPSDSTSLDIGKYYYELWRDEGDTGLKPRPVLAGFFWIKNVGPTLVNQTRNILGDAGQLRKEKITDEFIKPASLYKIYTTRQKLVDVEGVWLLADEGHSGTNYFTGGGFSGDKGEIWLGSVLPATLTHVRVSYTWQAGISDESINWHLDEALLFVKSYTGIIFDYGTSTTDRQGSGEAMAMARGLIGCILTLNGANMAQMGYNFRLDEFEIQSKLWGEGMIAEALFGVYIGQYNQWLQALGKVGVVRSITPTGSNRKYDLGTLIGYSDDLPETGDRS